MCNKLKDLIEAEISRNEREAALQQEKVQNCNWSNRPQDATYHEGMRVVYLSTAVSLRHIIGSK